MCEETKRTHPKLEEHTVDELIQIILRKDDVEKRSNNTIKELNSKLEQSEKLRYEGRLKVKKYRKQCFWYKIVISLLIILSLSLTYVALVNF